MITIFSFVVFYLFIIYIYIYIYICVKRLRNDDGILMKLIIYLFITSLNTKKK